MFLIYQSGIMAMAYDQGRGMGRVWNYFSTFA
jgi:hypothetical protein